VANDLPRGHGVNRLVPKKPSRNNTTDWGDVADWYDKLVGESGSEYHREVVLPGVLRLLALQTGEHALDVACGQGVLCRILHERGVRATGVDAAAPLIRAARERGPADITYHVGDARELSFLSENGFDAASCVLAVQNLHPIQPVFAGVSRALRERGRFVTVMMHPCFRGAKETSWGWDEAQAVQYRRVDRYLLPRKTPIVTHPGKDPVQYTWTFHKPIEAYVKALRNAGLLIDAIEEWPSHKTSTSGPRAAAENTARKEIPMFMAIRAIKVTP
jgi:ubiquinone/menaquinone biosynthesis C-methylase UbiE